MTREVVRRMRSEQTHVADVEGKTAKVMFGSTYMAPYPGVVTLCGVEVQTIEGVIMQEGSKVRCSACRYLSQKDATP